MLRTGHIILLPAVFRSQGAVLLADRCLVWQQDPEESARLNQHPVVSSCLRVKKYNVHERGRFRVDSATLRCQSHL